MPFPITCTACQKTFSIADDVYERKVKGRVVTIKCKQCQTGIRVDGSRDFTPARATDAATPPLATTAAAPIPVGEPALVAAAPVAADAEVTPTPTATDVAPVASANKVAAAASTNKAPPLASTTNTAAVASASKAASSATAGGNKAAAIAGAAKAASTPTSATKAAPVASATNAQAAGVPLTAPASTTTKSASTATAAKNAPAATAAKNAPIATTAKSAPIGANAKGAPITLAAKAAPLATPTRAVARATGGVAVAAGAVSKVEPAPEPESSALGATPKAPTASVPKSTSAGWGALTEIPPLTSPAAAPAALAPPSAVSPTLIETLWAVEFPDGADRELTLSGIARELAAGAVSPSSLVWREGMDEWQELRQVPELLALTAPPKPPPPREPAPPPPTRPKAASAPAIDAPNLTGAGLLPKPRPPAPSAPVLDFAPFSSQPIPAARARQPTISGIGEPEPVTTPNAALPVTVVPAFPPVPVMVPAPALAAPFAAPLQAFGQSSPAPVGASLPSTTIAEWPLKKRRTPLIIAALLFAVGAGLFLLTNSADDKLPGPTPIRALPAAMPNTKATAAQPPAPTTEPASSTGVGPGSRTALDPPTPTTTPNAGFAELFASGARHADSKKSDGGPSQHFDQNAAKASLSAVAFDTAKCREPGGPTGRATVVVTFEPSGKVSSSTVSDAPFAGTSSGACIAAALKRATVPAFTGLPGTVSKIISIQ
jgi:Meckel syndrome type 1 protein